MPTGVIGKFIKNAVDRIIRSNIKDLFLGIFFEVKFYSH
jgi:hypothetical protein